MGDRTVETSTISLSDLFWTFLKINTVTFGGGYTIVPVIRDEFILKKKLIDEDEMLSLVALAQSGPGAMAISASLLTGYKLRGPKGAVVSLAASVLPCIVIISVISLFYREFQSNPWVNAALTGMGGAISAVLFITVYNMGKSALKANREFGVVMMVAAFVLSFFVKFNTALIIAFLALSGLFYFNVVRGRL